MNFKIFRVLFPFLLLLLFLSSCEKKSKNEDPVSPEKISLEVSSCEGCHTNYDYLKEIYTPDPPSEGAGGCGGEAPHIEPYDRVYMGGEGYQEFKSGIHGKLECVTCHNGVGNSGDKSVAHSGDFISHPSTMAEEKCGSCHNTISEQTKNSLHANGWGQKSMVSLRYGAGNGPEAFNSLPEHLKEGYGDNCGHCHGTCGDCHVNRPSAGGGGLLNNHAFKKTPDMIENCVACHVSRGGHAYLGRAIGTVPDVHLSKLGYQCTDCHTANEVHGDGKYYNQRYSMSMLPKCENCHSGIEASNAYHQQHLQSFNCQVCHSQDYNNCGSCHIHGEGARIPSYQGFKIGMNPLVSTSKPMYEMALLRRSLTAPDSWKEYGVDNLSDFSVRPTYKYTTPHNILKWTTRTGVKNQDGTWLPYPVCSDGCHIYSAGDTVMNKNLYLFKSDLEDWEIEATEGITVDGKLPQSWPQ